MVAYLFLALSIIYYVAPTIYAPIYRIYFVSSLEVSICTGAVKIFDALFTWCLFDQGHVSEQSRVGFFPVRQGNFTGIDVFLGSYFLHSIQ